MSRLNIAVVGGEADVTRIVHWMCLSIFYYVQEAMGWAGAALVFKSFSSNFLLLLFALTYLL